MAVVTLTFTGSEEEIVSGIPKYLTIASSVPATIYFSIDGSTPSTSSPIYTSTFEMPDGENSVTVSAFGVDADNITGPILTQVFAPDTSRISVSRYTGAERFVLNRADSGADTPDGWDADGAPARFIDVDLETLDIIHSDRGAGGIAEGTRVIVGIPDPSSTGSLIDDGFVPFSTPKVGELFNPRARTILIDNREDNDLNITLRPFGALHDPYSEFGGKRVREPADDATYVSGGFVRRFYDAKNRIMVSYYFDHNEGRYVKNIQELPDNIVSGVGASSRLTPPLVFKWIYRGKQSSI